MKEEGGGESKLSKSRRTFFIFMPLCGHNNDKDDLMPLKQQNAVKAKETIYKADRGTLSLAAGRSKVLSAGFPFLVSLIIPLSPDK